MREFFHGWRRKAGCITLVIACAFMGMWLRANQICDYYLFGSGHDRESHSIVSTAAGLYWAREELPPDSSARKFSRSYQPGWNASPYEDYDWPKDFTTTIDVWKVDWRWRLCGFDFGEYHSISRTWYWVIPYWSIVLPLTVLSACLILWKPRKRVSRLVISDQQTFDALPDQTRPSTSVYG